MTKRPGPPKGTINNPGGRTPIPPEKRRVRLSSLYIAPETDAKLRRLAAHYGSLSRTLDAAVAALPEEPKQH